MNEREAYFARVLPLIGEGLTHKVVSVEDVSLTARVVELLASCMLRTVVVRDPSEPASWPLPTLYASPGRESGRQRRGLAADVLARYLEWKNGFLPMRWAAEGPADVHVAARRSRPGTTPHVVWNEAQRRVTMHLVPGDLWSFANLSYAVARGVREILLGREAWPQGVVYHGCDLWPFSRTDAPLPAGPMAVPDLTRAHVAVIGCGSVGSEVVRQLGGEVGRWTLIDDSRVTVFNPQRQWFGTGEIGEHKVEALGRRLASGSVRCMPERLDASNRRPLEALLEGDPPDCVVLSTGSNDDACLAALLQERAIPHIAAYAYPQARYFEITTVLEGSPCLHCFRGNLFRGLESAAPMSDEVARFLYQDLSEEEREGAYVNLVAEPATAVETGRIADVVSLCLRQVLAPPLARSPWFCRMLESGTTCLLGGNVVEDRGHGDTAYGLRYPGQVVRLGLEDIMGAEDLRVCPVCGRRLEVVHRLELPTLDDAAEVDEALSQ